MAVNINPNDPDAQNKLNEQNQGVPAQNAGGPASGGQNTASVPSPASNSGSAPQGSGRFTNIQKYLNANQAGGQQIAQKVGSNLQNQFGQQSQDAQKYYSQLGNSIANANQTAQTGAGYQKQLQDIGGQINQAQQAGFDQRNNQNLNGIQQFTQQPGFQQFQDIQAGRGIDQQLLAQQQQRAQAAAQAAAQGTQLNQQALSSQSGRSNLIHNTFANPSNNYSQGQQRLDTMLFGQGNGLNQVEAQNIANSRAAADQAKLATNAGSDVNRITAQEQGLIGDINTQATGNQNAYMNMLNSYVDPLNTQRTADFNNLNSAVQTYVPQYDAKGKMKTQAYQPGFNADQMARLGLTDQNQGVYNVFKNDVASANDIATQGRQAMNGQDVANQSDVDRYQALSKISGDQNPALTQASTLGNAWDAKTGEAGLKERLTAAQSAYDTAASNPMKVYSEIFPYNKNVNINASANDLTNQGRNAINLYSPINGSTNGASMGMTPKQTVLPAQNYNLNDVMAGKYGGAGKEEGTYLNSQYSPALIKQYQDFLNNQNYNQTIGGKRQTFLDTEAANELAKKGATPKIGGTPITGYDPSARNNAVKKLTEG